MPAIGPDFISLQVRDLDRSAAFYEQYLGLTRQPGPPHAIVFATQPVAFAVRETTPDVDLDSVQQPGVGVALWLLATDVRDLHDALSSAGVEIASAPAEGPFGLTFTFVDPDGYRVTLHDRG
jgi:predicted enzyme related to lactoylglutathione lyase